MKFNDCFKFPRLYVEAALKDGAVIELAKDQTHYLANVMRLKGGDTVRVFNGRNGEWLAQITEITKKMTLLHLEKCFKTQPQSLEKTHLIFAPIKKKNMGFLIEKAVELGVTDLHPVITARTQNRDLKSEKLETYILEAAEQCERLEIPKLHDVKPLKTFLAQWPHEHTIYWCAERLENTPYIAQEKAAKSFLIGPEGGFDDAENEILSNTGCIKPVHLGEQILRAETAALFCLAHAKLSKDT